MKKLLAALFAAAVAAQALCAQAALNNPLSAVVKIETVSCPPDFFSPWANKPQSQTSGSGVVIDGNLILTNAHNVSDATYISVSKNNDGFPAPASVLAVNHECDLALLKIEDGKFFEGITPMQIGDTPPIRTPVLAAGYPMGGNEISVTQGIISRIECRRYSHSYYGFFLAAQLDAAINPGNSGGPIIFDGKVVGIAFQGNSNGDGIGYMIHSDVIRHFLKDADDGKIDGFGKIGVHIADLINPDARRILKMGAKQSGILVCDVDKTSKSEPRLLENDVITSIDGFAIMNNANVLNERGENVFFKNIADRKRLGDIVKVGILRDGKEFLSEVTLTKPSYKVGPYLFDKRPRYIIAGGFVFSELSLSFLDELGNKVPPNIIDLLGEDNDPVDAETIVLTQVLGDESNMGYQNMGCEILESVNGKKIKTLKELADIVDAQKDGALTFKFESKTKVILDAKHIKDSAQSILKRYNIKSDRNL